MPCSTAPRLNSLAKQLSDLRVKKGLTLDQVAAATGQGRNTVALQDRGISMGWAGIEKLLELYGAQLVVVENGQDLLEEYRNARND